MNTTEKYFFNKNLSNIALNSSKIALHQPQICPWESDTDLNPHLTMCLEEGSALFQQVRKFTSTLHLKTDPLFMTTLPGHSDPTSGQSAIKFSKNVGTKLVKKSSPITLFKDAKKGATIALGGTRAKLPLETTVPKNNHQTEQNSEKLSETTNEFPPRKFSLRLKNAAKLYGDNSHGGGKENIDFRMRVTSLGCEGPKLNNRLQLSLPIIRMAGKEQSKYSHDSCKPTASTTEVYKKASQPENLIRVQSFYKPSTLVKNQSNMHKPKPRDLANEQQPLPLTASDSKIVIARNPWLRHSSKAQDQHQRKLTLDKIDLPKPAPLKRQQRPSQNINDTQLKKLKLYVGNNLHKKSKKERKEECLLSYLPEIVKKLQTEYQLQADKFIHK